MFLRISTAAVITAVSAALLSFIPYCPTVAAFNVAEVQRQVAATKNLAYTTSFLVDGKFEDSMRHVVREDGVMRYDSKHAYGISNLVERKSMVVRTDRQNVMVLEGPAYRVSESYNFYRLIHDIAKNPVRELGDRQIKGLLCKGIQVQLQMPESSIRTADVWVDPRTMLPVLIEMRYRMNGIDEVERLDRFEFDMPIPYDFFEMKPPEGFEVHTTGVTELAPEDADPAVAAPTVTPLVGIGPAKFRMTEAEVIDVLGKPERERTERNRKILYYYSQGIELEFLPPGNPRSGLQNIACLGQYNIPVKIREFKGKTDKGIGIGASRAEIEKTYGKPSYISVSIPKDANGNQPTNPEEHMVRANINYFDLGLRFLLNNDIVYRIDIYNPHSKPVE